MLQKTPKPFSWKLIRKSAAVLFVAEAVVFAVSYGAWYGVNTKREYRKYLHDNYPSVLNLYYTLGEKFDSNNSRIREFDYACWESEKH